MPIVRGFHYVQGCITALLCILLFAPASAHAGVYPGNGVAGVSVECSSGGYACTNGGYGGAEPWGYYTSFGSVDGAGRRHNCTSYAAFRAAQNGARKPSWYDNANGWDDKARAAGYPAVDGNAAVGAIAQWNSGDAGHVAYVEAVDAGGITITDDNYGTNVTRRVRIARGSPGWPDNFLHFADVPVGDPKANYDSGSSPTPGTIRVTGWAYDPDAPTAATEMHVYVGGQAGQPGTAGHAFVASAYRPDVGAAFPGVGNSHGLDVTFETAHRGNQSVCLYAINRAGSGNNVLLGCRNVVIADPNPLGAYDTLSNPAGGKVRVTGWTFDPNAPTQESQMHVYVGGPYGQPGARLYAFAASASRPDVNAVYPGVGDRHGLDVTFSVEVTGTQQVCLYAINTGPGGHLFLGCKSVQIAPAPPAVTTSSTTSTETPAVEPPLSSAGVQGAPAATGGPVTTASTAVITKRRVRRGRKLVIRTNVAARARLEVVFSRRGRVAKRTVATVRSGAVRVAAPRKAGSYRVTVMRAGARLTTATVRVI